MWSELGKAGEIDKIFKSADDEDGNDPEEQVIAQEEKEAEEEAAKHVSSVSSPVVQDPQVNGISLSDIIGNMETELQEAKNP